MRGFFGEMHGRAAQAQRSANRCLEVGHEGNLSARTRWP
jgi:hypothetical protein